MPKAAVHEHCDLRTGEDQIRRAWQITPLQPESYPGLVQETSYRKFWFGVLATDFGH